MSRKPRGGRIYSQIIALLPAQSPLRHPRIPPFYRESCRVGTYIKIRRTVGGEKGDDKKDSNLKDARMSGYRPCVHSICRRLRDPSHSLFLSVYLSLVTRIHRSYDRRALTPSVTRALCEKILYKKIEPRYSFSIM